MNEFENKFSQLKQVCENLSYDKSTVTFDRFHFVFEEIISGDTLQFIDFYAIEKNTNLIHKLRISVETEFFTVGMYFAFYNPFLKNHTITHVMLTAKEIDFEHFLLPLLKENTHALIKHGFPLDSFLSHLEK